MIEHHRNVILLVAQRCTCWIGVREPNPLSDRWIGDSRYVAKSEKCKAKTADNPGHRHGGLVVNPVKCLQAFKPASQLRALESWRGFLELGRLPPPFKCIESGDEMGLVEEKGKFIHADYDLLAIVRANDQGGFEPTSEVEQEELFKEIRPTLNQLLGKPMIQHGAELMWHGGIGMRDSEFILWFGPGGKSTTSYHSMGVMDSPRPMPS